jgi:hypothetical protein
VLGLVQGASRCLDWFKVRQAGRTKKIILNVIFLTEDYKNGLKRPFSLQKT